MSLKSTRGKWVAPRYKGEHVKGLSINPVAVMATKTGAVITRGNWSDYKGILLSLSFKEGTSSRFSGSAILVGIGIAICAAHVIEPEIAAINAGTVSLAATAIVGDKLALWVATSIKIVPDTDTAILILELCSDDIYCEQISVARITTRLPEKGELLSIVGHVPSDAEVAADEDVVLNISGATVQCCGHVSAIYTRERDSVMLPFPVAEVECGSFGSMSGGPVFDSHGLLIGILSSSIEAVDDDGPSFISFLWLALVERLESELFGSEANILCLLNLKEDVVSIDNRDAIVVETNVSSTIDKITYNPWTNAS